MSHHPEGVIQEFLRTQRRSIASAKALAKKREDDNRDRIRKNLERVEKAATERRIRSSPSAQTATQAKLALKFEEAELAEEGKVDGSIDQRTSLLTLNGDESFGASVPTTLGAPIPQSPISEVTSCMLSTSAVKGTCDLLVSTNSREGETPKTPERLEKEHIADVMKRCAGSNDVAELVAEEQHCQKPMLDPRREWELAPLKEALQRFSKSDEIFQRPATTTQPLVSLQQSSASINQNVSMMLQSRSNSKHSILSLLQLHGQRKQSTVGKEMDGDLRADEKPSPANDKLSSENKVVAAQTQTEDVIKNNSDKSCPPTHELKSVATCSSDHSSFQHEETKHVGDDQDFDDGLHNESFPSYNSTSTGIAISNERSQPSAVHSNCEARQPMNTKSNANSSSIEGSLSSCDEAKDASDGASSVVPSQYDESFPSYNSDNSKLMNHQPLWSDEAKDDDGQRSESAANDVSSGVQQEHIQENARGCAWVFNFNGGDDADHADDDAQNSIICDEKNRTGRQTNEEKWVDSSDDEPTSGSSDEDEYDSDTFLSENY